MSYEDFYATDFGRFVLMNEAGYVAKKMHGLLLSVGCGTGIIEREIAKEGNEIICLEPSEEMVKLARSRVEVVEGYAENMPFRDGMFDGVFFITSLEFVNDYKKAIEEAHRVLKENGVFLAMMLNFSSDYFARAYEKEGYIRRNIKHMNNEMIKKHAEEFFDTRHSLFLCEDMGSECDDKNKLLYVVEGIKLLP